MSLGRSTGPLLKNYWRNCLLFRETLSYVFICWFIDVVVVYKPAAKDLFTGLTSVVGFTGWLGSRQSHPATYVICLAWNFPISWQWAALRCDLRGNFRSTKTGCQLWNFPKMAYQ